MDDETRGWSQAGSRFDWPATLHWSSIVIIIATVAGLGILQVRKAVLLGNNLSDIADPYSESDAIRSGEAYATFGFSKNMGLPDIAFGGQFPDQGAKSIPERRHLTEWVYKHYPPGPNLLVGFYTKWFGVGNIVVFRLFPIFIGLLSIAFLAWALMNVFGPAKSALAMLAFSWAPMFWNMMHGLHYQGYAFSILLVQFGVLLVGFERRDTETIWPVVAVLAFLGFLQGWLSFDYIFLVSFSALPFWMSFYEWKQREQRRRLFQFTMALTLGFAFALFLHFVQVSLYLGGLKAGFDNFAAAALKRSVGYGASDGVRHDHLTMTWLLRHYLLVLLPSERFFGFNLVGFALVVLGMVAVGDISFTLGRRVPIRFEWKMERRAMWGLGSAFVIAVLWVVVMRQHAVFHGHFIPRHFFIFYFFCILVLLKGSTLRFVRNEEAEVPDARESFGSL